VRFLFLFLNDGIFGGDARTRKVDDMGSGALFPLFPLFRAE
jgi:hypothetical protein